MLMLFLIVVTYDLMQISKYFFKMKIYSGFLFE